MGFSLLIPAYQAISTGRTFPAEKYVRRKNFLVKWIYLVCLPLFVLSYPLVSSLGQLSGFTIWILDRKEICLIVSITWDIAILCYYVFVVRRFSKLMGWKDLKEREKQRSRKNRIFREIVEDVPTILLVVCLLMWSSDLTSFSFYEPDVILILLAITGISLILRNSGIKIDDGIVFRKQDISPEFEQEKDSFANKINKAKAERKREIGRMQSILAKYEKDYEIKRSVGLHNGEIKNLLDLKDEIEKRFNDIISKINKDENVTFEDFFEYDGWRREGERHLEEFRKGTMVAQKVLDELKKDHA